MQRTTGDILSDGDDNETAPSQKKKRKWVSICVYCSVCELGVTDTIKGEGDCHTICDIVNY